MRWRVQLADRDLDQIADDRLDIAPDIADLGELGRLDLDERRIDELRDPPRDFGFADAGRVRPSGCFWVESRAGSHRVAMPAVPIAQRDRDGAFRVVLADDELLSSATISAGGQVFQRRPVARAVAGPALNLPGC